MTDGARRERRTAGRDHAGPWTLAEDAGKDRNPRPTQAHGYRCGHAWVDVSGSVFWPLQAKLRCVGYAECPVCPLGSIDFQSPYACAQAHNLLEAVRRAAETMAPQVGSSGWLLYRKGFCTPGCPNSPTGFARQRRSCRCLRFRCPSNRHAQTSPAHGHHGGRGERPRARSQTKGNGWSLGTSQSQWRDQFWQLYTRQRVLDGTHRGLSGM